MDDSTADYVEFYELCQFFNDISILENKKSKEQLFQGFFYKWFQNERKNCSIYQVIRLMVPLNTIEDCILFEYNNLVTIISSNLDRISLLLKWYPSKNESSKTSIGTLNKYIDQLKHSDCDENIIHELLSDMSNLERKWFLLILLSEVEDVTKMKLDTLIWCMNPSLGQFLEDGCKLEELLLEYHPKTFSEAGMKDKLKSIKIGRPFLSMKLNDFGYTKNVFSAIQRFCKGRLLAGYNYYGEKIIIHRYNNGRNYKFFSDNMDDFTKCYASSNYDFSKEIEPFFKSNIRNTILEGKLLAQCCVTGKIFEKFDTTSDGTYYDTKSMDGNDKNVRICLIVSDILYINDEDLTTYPLEERLNILNKNVFNGLNGKTVIILEHKEISNYEEFFEYFKNSIIRMQEGFILKDSGSTYIPGPVPIYHCIFKIKPNYNRFVVLNLCLVGVEYCEDKPSTIKYFLLAAKDSSNVLTICLKVHATSRSELFDKLIDSTKINDNYYNEQPQWLKSYIQESSYIRYVNENNIRIVEVKWQKINSGTEELSYIYTIRNDLSMESVNFLCDIEHFNEKFNVGLDNVEVLPHKVNNLYRGDSSTKRTLVEIENTVYWNYFEQFTICVLNCPQNFDIRKIQKFIYFLGGSIVSHPTKDTNYIIATDPVNVKTAAALQMKNIPILDASWAIRCINEKKLQKINFENDVLLLEGYNQFSIEDLDELIQEQDIPDDIYNNICM